MSAVRAICAPKVGPIDWEEKVSTATPKRLSSAFSTLSTSLGSSSGTEICTTFEPSSEEVLAYLLGHYLTIYLYYALLSAKASEQSARMVSMKNATDSAEDLISALTLEYNKLRQGNITRELLEIAGGQAG